MTNIIDTNNDTSHVLGQLKSAGVETIIRYITTSTQSEKCVKPAEAKAIAAAGLNLGLVFETWGGSGDFSHGDINSDSGARHGAFARDWAGQVGAPDGIVIWFAIDNDVSQDQFARYVRPYFTEVKKALAGKYRTGIYGCGFACQQCLDLGLVDAAWLANAMGWNGSKAFRASNRWHLLQSADSHMAGLSVDPNEANGDYGAFVPFAAAPVAPAPHVAEQPASGPAPVSTGPSALDQIKLMVEDALKVKALAGATTPGQPGPSPSPPDFTTVLKAAADLNAALSRAQPQAGDAGPPPILSSLDKVLGGQAMVGLKTPLAIVAYAVMYIMQAVGAVGPLTGPGASTAAQVVTALIGGLGGFGILSKFDRGIQALSIVANVVQKLSQPVPTLRPGG
jgi:hypothetical protein